MKTGIKPTLFAMKTPSFPPCLAVTTSVLSVILYLRPLTTVKWLVERMSGPVPGGVFSSGCQAINSNWNQLCEAIALVTQLQRPIRFNF